MSAHAEPESSAEPSEVAATPRLRVLRERRTDRESAGRGLDLDCWLAGAILGGAAVIYGLLGVVLYLAMTRL